MQHIPQIWPGWQVVDAIGRGSFGTVYRAVDAHGNESAIKVIVIPADPEELNNLVEMNYDALSIRSYFKEQVDVVKSEIEAMQELRDAPHVVRIEDYQLIERTDEVGWEVYIRMELLESLSKIVMREGIPDQRTAAQIGAAVCDALAACHEHGVIHRDVKPSNVFRSRDGIYKLGDFGLSRHSSMMSVSTKSTAGTPTYMAPEVLSGHYQESVDLYSLGIMLYRWLNGGKPPFVDPRRPSSQAALAEAESRRMRGVRPPLPAGDGVDRSLAQIVMRAIEPQPRDRWSSAREMGEALTGWLTGARDVAYAWGDPALSDVLADDPISMKSVDAMAAVRAAEEAARHAEDERAQKEAEEARRRAEEQVRRRKAEEERQRKQREQKSMDPPAPTRKASGVAAAAAVLVLAALVVFVLARGAGAGKASTSDDSSATGAAEAHVETSADAATVQAPELSLGFDQYETLRMGWGPAIRCPIGSRGFIGSSDGSSPYTATLYLDEDHTYYDIHPASSDQSSQGYRPYSLGHVQVDSVRISVFDLTSSTYNSEAQWKEYEQTKYLDSDRFSNASLRQLSSQTVSGYEVHVYEQKALYTTSAGDKQFCSNYYGVLETQGNLLRVTISIVNTVEQLGYLDGENLLRDFLANMELTGL